MMSAQKRESGRMMIRGQSGLALVSVLILCGLAAHHANAAPPTRAEAFRFLNQATFGPTSAEIDRLTALGDSSQAYAQWIDEQMATGHPPPIPAGPATHAASN